MAEVQFVNFTGANQDLGECAICMESLSNGRLVAHTSGGEKHPIHKTCIDEVARHCRQNREPSCPLCRKTFKAEQLLNLNASERPSSSPTEIQAPSQSENKSSGFKEKMIALASGIANFAKMVFHCIKEGTIGAYSWVKEKLGHHSRPTPQPVESAQPRPAAFSENRARVNNPRAAQSQQQPALMAVNAEGDEPLYYDRQSDRYYTQNDLALLQLIERDWLN